MRQLLAALAALCSAAPFGRREGLQVNLHDAAAATDRTAATLAPAPLLRLPFSRAADAGWSWVLAHGRVLTSAKARRADVVCGAQLTLLGRDGATRHRVLFRGHRNEEALGEVLAHATDRWLGLGRAPPLAWRCFSPAELPEQMFAALRPAPFLAKCAAARNGGGDGRVCGTVQVELRSVFDACPATAAAVPCAGHGRGEPGRREELALLAAFDFIIGNRDRELLGCSAPRPINNLHCLRRPAEGYESVVFLDNGRNQLMLGTFHGNSQSEKRDPPRPVFGGGVAALCGPRHARLWSRLSQFGGLSRREQRTALGYGAGAGAVWDEKVSGVDPFNPRGWRWTHKCVRAAAKRIALVARDLEEACGHF